MKEHLALDLKLSRTKAGLSGGDLAHLLGCNAERVSRLENGKARIKADEMAALSLIYGHDPTVWLRHVTLSVAGKLKRQMSLMPSEPNNWAHLHDARLDTLNGLTYRLQALSQPDYGT